VAINVKADVEAEAEAKKAAVEAYDSATLDSDLERIETLAEFMADAAHLVAMVDASNGAQASKVARDLLTVSRSLSAVPGTVRGLIQNAKDAVNPPVVEGP
jgi:nucleoside diphosphate kinase